jgi:hypothetical protein
VQLAASLNAEIEEEAHRITADQVANIRLAAGSIVVSFELVLPSTVPVATVTDGLTAARAAGTTISVAGLEADSASLTPATGATFADSVRGALPFDVPMVITQDTKLPGILLALRVTSGPGVDGAHYSRTAVAMDFDGDSHTDLFIVNVGQLNQLLINDRLGGFVATTSGPVVEGSLNSYGAVAADFDGDFHIDIFVANFRALNRLMINDGLGGFVAATSGPVVEGLQCSYDAVAADFDGDSHTDIFVANQGQPNQLMINNGLGGFVVATSNDICGELAQVVGQPHSTRSS